MRPAYWAVTLRLCQAKPTTYELKSVLLDCDEREIQMLTVAFAQMGAIFYDLPSPIDYRVICIILDSNGWTNDDHRSDDQLRSTS